MPAVGSPFLAVDLFFGLSGFVLGLAYDRKLAEGLTAASFMKKRIIRLYPMYALGLIIGTVAALSHGESVGSSQRSFAIATILNFLLIPAFHASSLLFPANAAAWSLFFEFLINAVYAFGRSMLAGYKIAIPIALGAISLVMSVRYHHYINSGAHFYSMTIAIPRVVFSFFVGLVLSRLHQMRPPTLALPSWAILTAVAVALLLPIPNRFANLFGLTCILLAFPALIYLGSCAKERRPELGAYLGDASYALYAIHVPILALYTAFLRSMHVVHRPLLGVLYLAGIVPLSFVAHQVLDRPVRSWLTSHTTVERMQVRL